jgi:hypothetical protein
MKTDINSMARGQLIEHYLARLQNLRYCWRDKIPQEIIRSTSKDSKYKCRTTWFGITRLTIDALHDSGFIKDGQYSHLVRRYEDTLAKADQHGITRAEINKGNKILDEVIKSLWGLLTNKYPIL